MLKAPLGWYFIKDTFNEKQAGAELGQAQVKLEVIVEVLVEVKASHY